MSSQPQPQPSGENPSNTRPATPPDGKCLQGGTREKCPLVCKYNYFEKDDLTINAWELKCLDCGWRDTIGFRSDELDEDEVGEDFNPKQCPFCNRCDMQPGKNPCELA